MERGRAGRLRGPPPSRPATAAAKHVAAHRRPPQLVEPGEVRRGGTPDPPAGRGPRGGRGSLPAKSISSCAALSGSGSCSETRKPASATSMARSITICFEKRWTSFGSAPAGAVATAQALPSRPSAASRRLFGSALASFGRTSESGDSGMPSLADRRLQLEAARDVLVGVERGGGTPCRSDCDTEIERHGGRVAGRNRLDLAAGLADDRRAADVRAEEVHADEVRRRRRGVRHRHVERVCARRPSTTSGCVNVSVNVGFRTSTAPAARPVIGTGPTGRPLQRAGDAHLDRRGCLRGGPRRGTRRCRSRPARASRMSSAVPSLPSAPGLHHRLRRAATRPSSSCAMRSGSSAVPTTRVVAGRQQDRRP